MSRVPKSLAIAFLFGLLALAPAASAQRFGGGFRGGGFGARGGFGFAPRVYVGAGWYNPWGYAPYGYGYWSGPYYGAYGYEYQSHPKNGDVKIDTKAKDALVYVDGGYAGKSKDLRKFPLSPGNHTIELRDPSGNVYHSEQINVISGKTIDIRG
jgi:hypothetical protein